jgi:MFS family permease
VVITGLALFMASLDNLVVSTALPVIRVHLHAGLSGLEWTVNAYTLTFAVLLLSAAALGERFGRRRIFVAGIALFTASSALAALAPTISFLVAARALQGAGGAMIMPLSLTLLSAAVPPEQSQCPVGSTALQLVLNSFGSTGRFGLTCSHEAPSGVVGRALPAAH